MTTKDSKRAALAVRPAALRRKPAAVTDGELAPTLHRGHLL